jgi:hypothetical protein
MGKIVDIKIEKYRLLVAIRYLNSSEDIWKGLKRQRGVNDFHFLITLRSFIEYARRGIWFLAWADEKTLKAAEKATFQRPESPGIIQMDKMINGALGLGKFHTLQRTFLASMNRSLIACTRSHMAIRYLYGCQRSDYTRFSTPTASFRV